jgi:hypothetical protein
MGAKNKRIKWDPATPVWIVLTDVRGICKYSHNETDWKDWKEELKESEYKKKL